MRTPPTLGAVALLIAMLAGLLHPWASARAGDGAPDPQSEAYLALFALDDGVRTRAIAGRRMVLLDRLPAAESIDYDPIADIHHVSIRWRQLDGPSVEILDAETPNASVTMPTVQAPTDLTFEVTVTNDAGARTGAIVITVIPAP